MPFRNPIASIGGTLIVDKLQSSDFSFSPGTPWTGNPNYNVTGWKLDNTSPASFFTEQGWFEQLRVPATVTFSSNHNWNATDYVDTTRDLYSRPWYGSGVSLTLSTSDQVAIADTAELYIPPLAREPGPSGGFRQSNPTWLVTGVFDIRGIVTPTGTAIGGLGVAGPTGGFTEIGQQALFAAKTNGERATVVQQWLLGWSPYAIWAPTDGWETFRCRTHARATVASQYTTTIHTTMSVIPTIRLDYST